MGDFPDLAGRGGGEIAARRGCLRLPCNPSHFPLQPGSRSLAPKSTRGAGPVVGSGVGSDVLLSFRFSNQPGITHLTFSQALQELPDVTTVLSDDLLLDPANFTDHRIRDSFGCRV